MGMLINGLWSEEDHIYKGGEYIRQHSVYSNDIGAETVAAIVREPGRFHLIASWSCPWSHRAMLIRQIKGLAQYIPLHITGGKRLQGYSANFGNNWQVPGCEKMIVHLHELYTLNDPYFTGRSTVPILWDSYKLKVVSNESSKIVRALDAVKLSKEGNTDMPNFTLYPSCIRADIDALNDLIYSNLSNAVYRADFAKEPLAYRKAVAQVFGMLDELETRLAESRYLFGDVISEADWRLFPTLVRFDLDYNLNGKCTRRRLVDYPNLWGYARDLYSWHGVSDTVNFEAIHESNYLDSLIVPDMPLNDWRKPHKRHEMGVTSIMLLSGEKVTFNKNKGRAKTDYNKCSKMIE